MTPWKCLLGFHDWIVIRGSPGSYGTGLPLVTSDGSTYEWCECNRCKQHQYIWDFALRWWNGWWVTG